MGPQSIDFIGDSRLFELRALAFSILLLYTVCVNASETEKESQWQKTPVANLVRNALSGIYYARVRVRGKLIWKTLKTDRMSVAKLRLGDFLKEENHRAEVHQASSRGKMTFADALAIYEQQLKDSHHLKPSAKLYREKSIKALLKSWPGLKDLDVRKISTGDCLQWASRFAHDYSPSVFNNTVGTLRHVVEISIRSGARYGNPAEEIKKVRVRQKVLKLPEHDRFLSLVKSVRTAGGRFSKDCADLIEFFAYSGARKSEAARVFGSDCDFSNGRISIKGDPDTGTKNWEVRTIPMIPDMRHLLELIRSEKGEAEWLKNPVVGVRECQKAIDTACAKLQIERFTHHDLRHLFATRCIESGVDIPTVSRWLGHKDGGALAMKTYGHLRDQHSTAMAQKVVFSASNPSNVIRLPLKEEQNQSGVENGDQKKAIAKAKAKYKYPWWASRNSLEVFWGQINEDVQIVPSEKYLEAAKTAMEREVFPHEFEDPQSLRDEFVERMSAETLGQLVAKIPQQPHSENRIAVC
jgi:integrase